MPTKCIVLGAGIIGVNAAFRLAQQGFEVTLVDAGAPAAGTTGTSGSLVGANEKRPWEYYELGLMSMEAMRRLAGELEHDDWFLPNGHLEWGTPGPSLDALKSRVAQLIDWNYPVEYLTPREVKEKLEPDLNIPPDVEQVAFFSGDSIVYPHQMIALILRELRTLGVEFRFGSGEASLLAESSSVTGVKLASGERLQADVVVCCVGRWTEAILRTLDVNLPMVDPWGQTPESLGLQVITTSAPVEVRRMIRMPGLSIRPAGGGRLMLHGRPEEQELHALGEASGLKWDNPLSPAPPQAGALLAKAARALENLQSTKVQSATASVRALTEDGLPVSGWVDGVNNLYAVVTHSGIGLGPLLGELVAAELSGTTVSQLAPFRPGRFSAASYQIQRSPMRQSLGVHAPTN